MTDLAERIEELTLQRETHHRRYMRLAEKFLSLEGEIMGAILGLGMTHPGLSQEQIDYLKDISRRLDEAKAELSECLADQYGDFEKALGMVHTLTGLA